MRTYIVTGATGFIGYALVKHILECKDKVIAVVRPDSGRGDKLNDLKKTYGEKLTVEKVSLDNLEALEGRFEADVFFHLAWNGSSGIQREDFDIQYSNIGYTAKAMRVAKICGCTKFIGAGSQAEYGVVRGLAKEDEVVPRPFMMYGAAKLATYEMCKLLASKLDISFVWPRIYSVYGVGENKGTLVNYVIDSLLEGNTPELSPCENMWNFIYIDDCVKILKKLADDKDSNGVYHVASKDTRLLKDFVSEIRDIVAPGANLGFGIKESNPERTFWLEPDICKVSSFVEWDMILFDKGIKCKLEGKENV